MPNLPPHLPGARVLGQAAQVDVTTVRLAPNLFVDVVTTSPIMPLAQPCLQVVDQMAGTCTLSPLTPQFARRLAGQLTKYADAIDNQEGTRGESTLHE